MKVKVVESEYLGHIPALRLPDGVVFSVIDGDYISMLPLNDELREIVEKEMGKLDEPTIMALPMDELYSFYESVPDDTEIDVPEDAIARAIGGVLGRDVFINAERL